LRELEHQKYFEVRAKCSNQEIYENYKRIHIEDVLAHRKAICEEFATLAWKMFERAEIRCVFIAGHARQGDN